VFWNRDWLYQSKWDPILLNSWPSCRYLHQIGPDHRGVLNVKGALFYVASVQIKENYEEKGNVCTVK